MYIILQYIYSFQPDKIFWSNHWTEEASDFGDSKYAQQFCVFILTGDELR